MRCCHAVRWSRWRRFRIRSQSRHSRRAVPTKRSAIAFAFGARTGVVTTPDAFAREDGVEAARELTVSVADQEAEMRRRLVECRGELAGLLGDPGAGGVGGDAGEVDAAAAHLDEEPERRA